jgi:hypothetical protein
VTEAALQRKIQAALRDRGGKVIKVHGGAYAVAGTPDLIGAIDGVSFAIEVKRPGERPSAKQEAELSAWAAQGWATGVACSVQDAMEIVDAAPGRLTA